MIGQLLIKSKFMKNKQKKAFKNLKCLNIIIKNNFE